MIDVRHEGYHVAYKVLVSHVISLLLLFCLWHRISSGDTFPVFFPHRGFPAVSQFICY